MQLCLFELKIEIVNISALKTSDGQQLARSWPHAHNQLRCLGYASYLGGAAEK